MKHILIVSHAMEIGGAERSLIGLLSMINPENCKVDLFLLRHEGKLLGSIPDYVNLLPEIPAYTVLARPMKDILSEGHMLLTIARLYGKCRAFQYNRKKGYYESGVALEYSHKYTYRLMPKIQSGQEYDLAISFLTPHYIVANNVKAKKKIAWIHTDYSKLKIDVASEKSMWSAYDQIISISESVSEGFTNCFPTLADRLVLIENILPEKLIRKQAKEFDVVAEMPQDETIHLLSIGRYCYSKNFDSIPEICSLLVKKGLNVKWYIIGFGRDEDLIKKKIQAYHMEDTVILLGKKENPYPYITACDLYVQPSRYEGKSVTVREAQMLGKPVLITKFPTSTSQLEDGVDGIIVPMDNMGCADGIADVLRNPQMIKQLSEGCFRRDYSNQQEVDKIYKLIEIEK